MTKTGNSEMPGLMQSNMKQAGGAVTPPERKEVNKMTEREYYENLESVTANGDCEKCMYGCEGECHLECNKSYIDYMRELRECLDSI